MPGNAEEDGGAGGAAGHAAQRCGDVAPAVETQDGAGQGLRRLATARAVFIDFLRRLLRDCGGRRVHLVVDGHPVHRAKLVSAWVERHAAQIQLHFLPGYSPELNPVELLNHDVKANAAGRRRPRSAGELRDELHGYLRRWQRQPQVLLSGFDYPTTRYAAAS